jgi:alkaline phosphatase D
LLRASLLVCITACATRGTDRRAAEDEIDRIAFGSCALQWEEQPIWDAVVAEKPDLFLFLGDAIYGDWDGERSYEVSPESLRREWRRLGDKPEFRRLSERVPVLATWDNHDFGKHDGGAEFPLREESRQVFLDFFGEPEDSERRRTPGVYDARVFGPPGRRAQVILLDTRYFKGPFVRDPRSAEERESLGVVGKYLPNEDPDVTLLGDDQWRWLEERLCEPAELRLIASSTQVIADQKGMDEWGNFPLERRRLLELVERTGANGVVFLSGNVHFAEVSMFDEGPYPLYDFTSSGLTHVDPKYGEAPNPYRIAGPLVALNFGLVEIDWSAEPAPQVTFRAIGVSGELAFEHGLSLESLRP